MRLVSEKNLVESIRNSNEYYLWWKKFLRNEVFALLGTLIVGPFLMIVGLHNKDWIHIFGSSLFSFVILSSFIGHVLMNAHERNIKNQVQESEIELSKFREEVKRKGVLFLHEDIKKAKIGEKEIINANSVQKLFPFDDFEVINAMSRDIKVTTREGKIQILKQIRAKITDYLGYGYIDLVCLSDEKDEDINVKRLTN
jgi:predicted membrane protein